MLKASDPLPLEESQAWCERVCRQSGSSFFHSFALLDRPRRRAMHALYAFARITDDLGDCDEPLAIRSAKLAGWRELLAEQLPPLVVDSEPIAPALASSTSDVSTQMALQDFASLWPALVDCVSTYDIPVQLLDDLAAGVGMDLAHEPPADWDELRTYCYHVASSVGLACTHIWRSDADIPTQHAIDCGFAFQLTNIIRDVAEDAAMGRIYIPISKLEEFGVDRGRWLRGDPDGAWPELIEQVAAEARGLYASGWHTIEALTPRSQQMFSLMWRSYRDLLEHVVASQDQLWSGRRIQLSKRRRLRLLTSHLLPALLARPRQ